MVEGGGGSARSTPPIHRCPPYFFSGGTFPRMFLLLNARERIVMADLTVYKNRTNVIQVHLGFNVSSDTITSEIRDKAKVLLATWTVSFLTNGVDGKLVLTLDNTQAALITAKTGLMDFKRMTNGEPLSLIDEPIDVTFKDTITQ